MSVANKIKYVMSEKNKKRDDIAKTLQISNQAVSNKFNRDSFSVEDLIKTADCLGVSLALLDNNKTIIFDLDDIRPKNIKN
jgi:transcriptional regulator with XRE-family HTH domain